MTSDILLTNASLTLQLPQPQPRSQALPYFTPYNEANIVTEDARGLQLSQPGHNGQLPQPSKALHYSGPSVKVPQVNELNSNVLSRQKSESDSTRIKVPQAHKYVGSCSIQVNQQWHTRPVLPASKTHHHPSYWDKVSQFHEINSDLQSYGITNHHSLISKLSSGWSVAVQLYKITGCYIHCPLPCNHKIIGPCQHCRHLTVGQ